MLFMKLLKDTKLMGIFCLSTFIFFLNCKPKNDYSFDEKMLQKIPDSIIKMDVMIDVMTDVHLAESASQEIKKVDSIPVNRVDSLQNYYDYIFSYYNIDSSDFRRSYKYYVNQPLLMNYMYGEILEKLTIMESENKQPKNK